MSKESQLAKVIKENAHITAAVIGAGSGGLATLKNLLEFGFDAFAFERRDMVGGLWSYAKDTKITSALPTTVANASKQLFCFTDFPFPDDAKTHPTQSDIESYMKSYAEHFDLYPHIRFGITVVRVFRDDSDAQWIIEYKAADESKLERVEVDKVVFAHGDHTTPNMPKLAGLELFKGEVLHSQTFKTPQPYKDKRVLVLGCNNTAADAATSLVGIASEIYISHRRGVRMVPRILNGKPFDHALSHRGRIILGALDRLSPDLPEYVINLANDFMMKNTYKLEPKWGFANPPSMCQNLPLCSDNLVDDMLRGAIVPVTGVEKVAGEDEILSTDGTKINVDVIVYATGYRPNISICPTNELHLYHSIFSLTYPTSLAYVGFAATLLQTMVQYDLCSMYAAQVFCGLTKLPPLSEMKKAVAKDEKWRSKRLAKGSVTEHIVPSPPWLEDLSRQVGTGVWENLGYGWQGWKFWWNDRKFFKVAMDGVDSPHLYRLFEGEGKRPVWKGAREAICKANSVEYISPPKS